ncbi:MAG: sigma-70 family RNA polymerase sigma factor [Pirellulales bacterium]|nr:sigma-70 family RNA polymerase sigma factor [Pirellulales bacterium]
MVESSANPSPDLPSENPNTLQWRRVYWECESGLRAFLKGRLSQEVDVDDCLQAVFVKMVEQSQKPGPDVVLAARRAWLFRVAANEAAALWRRKASTEKMIRRHGGGESLQPDVTEKLILTETTVKVRQAITALPVNLRQIVQMRMDQNLTFQQIATQLDIPLGTALTRMRRALQRLKNELHPDNQS